MRFSRQIVLVLSVWWLSTGCVMRSSQQEMQLSWLQTDKPVYQVSKTGKSIVTTFRLVYTNRGATSIYIVGCGGPEYVLEKQTLAGWSFAYGHSYADCEAPPVKIEPGSSYVYNENFAVSLPGDRSKPHFMTEVPGRYRFVFRNIYHQPSPEGLLAESARISNTFTFELVEGEVKTD